MNGIYTQNETDKMIADIVRLREENERLRKVVEAARKKVAYGYCNDTCDSVINFYDGYYKCNCGFCDLQQALKELDGF